MDYKKVKNPYNLRMAGWNSISVIFLFAFFSFLKNLLKISK